MSRAIIKHKKKKQIGRSKILDKKYNTKLEKRIKQIAQDQIDRDKKQKLLVRTLFGLLHPPTISAHQAAGADNKYEEPYLNNAEYICGDNLLVAAGGFGFKRNIWYFPQIRCMPSTVNVKNEVATATKFQPNSDYCYIDGDECGYGRETDEIRMKGFKISGQINLNPKNKSFETEVVIAVFKIDPEFTFKQRTIQYMFPSENQNMVMPKRLISDLLGSDDNGETLTPDTAGIKKRVFYKKWRIKPKQELYLTADTANLTYNERNIQFNYYVETDQKIEYSRSKVQTDGVRDGTIAMNYIDNETGYEKVDFKNCKYAIITKSNILTAGAADIAPTIVMNITSYFTDINS